LAETWAVAPGPDADQLARLVANEWMKHAGRIAAAADTGDDHIGQPRDLIQALLPRLTADDRLKIPHDHRKRVRADHAAQDVMRVLDARHPIAQSFVDRIPEGPATRAHGNDLGAQRLHLENVETLPADIFLTHVDLALQAEECG